MDRFSLLLLISLRSLDRRAIKFYIIMCEIESCSFFIIKTISLKYQSISIVTRIFLSSRCDETEVYLFRLKYFSTNDLRIFYFNCFSVPRKEADSQTVILKKGKFA